MNRYYIDYSKEAKQDLIDIKRYIKYNLQEPNTANNLIYKIRQRIDKLICNPQIYPIIDDNWIKKFEIRKFIIDNYIVFYKIKNYEIHIVRILYKKRNWMKII